MDQWETGWLSGSVCVCVCFMFEFQTWSPCKEIIISRLPDVKEKYPSLKKLRNFDWPLRVLKNGILKIWKYWQNLEYLRILELFSDLTNSTFKYLYRSCKVPPLFPPHRSAQEQTEKTEKFESLSMTLEVLKSGILKIWRKCQNPEIFRIPELFSDLKNFACKYV